MPQAILPFKFEEEKHSVEMTSLAGLPTYLELSYVIGLTDSISRCLNVRDNGQGFKDHEMLMSLVLLNLAGGMLPSGKFGVNAAWRAIMILALNLNSAMYEGTGPWWAMEDYAFQGDSFLADQSTGPRCEAR